MLRLHLHSTPKKLSCIFELRENEPYFNIFVSGNLLEKTQICIDELTICKISENGGNNN
jgi:hypothetical protein